jgi:hypothetical protein
MWRFPGFWKNSEPYLLLNAKLWVALLLLFVRIQHSLRTRPQS